ncbi:MAG: DUF1848 domain-containing protein [Fidelibacterota bacterium]
MINPGPAFIISASRRTDIPAFYSEWFIRRIREGEVYYRNPFGGQLLHASLKPGDVLAVVFWSKDYTAFMRYLPELEDRGYSFYFHYTITGLPEIFEKNVPHLSKTSENLMELSERYSPDHVIWRFDPIIISDVTPPDHYIKTFSQLAEKFRGKVKRCIISFVHFYSKVQRNMIFPLLQMGIKVTDPNVDEKKDILSSLYEISRPLGMEIYSCCNSELTGAEIKKAHCIDGSLIEKLFPGKRCRFKTVPTRKGCGCTYSKDIGAYNTCIHGCIYCYANADKEKAGERRRSHDPYEPILLQ